MWKQLQRTFDSFWDEGVFSGFVSHFSLSSSSCSPWFCFSLQKNCSQMCLHPWKIRRLFKRHFHILILLSTIQILTNFRRSLDCKRVFISETHHMADVQWWDSGVTAKNILQAMDKEENKTWKVTCLLSRNKKCMDLEAWQMWKLFNKLLRCIYGLFQFQFWFSVLCVSLVLTKWKWDFALSCLHRRAGDWRSSLPGLLCLSPLSSLSAWIKLTIYFLHPPCRKLSKNCIPQDSSSSLKVLQSRPEGIFFFFLPQHILHLHIHIYMLIHHE